MEWAEVTSVVALRYILIAGLMFSVFYWLLKSKFAHRKIQNIFPKVKDYRRDITYSLIAACIFGVQLMLVGIVFKDHTLLFDNPAEFHWLYHVFTFFFMVFLHDTYFYWCHRSMHHPKIFKHVHLVHHKSHNPSPWASYAFHPLEAVIEGGIVPLIAFTIPVWTPLFIFFLFFQLMVNVYGHTGYEMLPKNFHKSKVGRWINTSVAHNMHHKYFKGNYSLYFMFWDRLMGTVHKNYEDMYEQTTNQSDSQ